jgi:DNA/RNA endonuclease YhcR with UshA esterase domain
MSQTIGRKFGSSLLFWLLLIPVPAQTEKIAAVDAKHHIGETLTVCGLVVDTRYAESIKGSPTFLNFERPFPRQVFTVLIWGNYRAAFDKPEEQYRGQRICVTGKIISYKSRPEIEVRRKNQITIETEDKSLLPLTR